MKVHVLSDLHLGVHDMERPLTDADVVVLAGDIGPPRLAAAWAMRFDKPVLYVLGNHEFYGGCIERTAAEFERLCTGTQVHVLDDSEIVLDGVRFLGSTLWTDFMLQGDGQARQFAVDAAQRFMRDFSRIRNGDGNALFTPADAAARFARHAAWLDAKLDTAHAGPTVVITHHAPSPHSIHPRFAGSALNACFVSDAEQMVGAARCVVDPRPYPRQLRLRAARHPRHLQPARLRQERRQREPAVRPRLDDRDLSIGNAQRDRNIQEVGFDRQEARHDHPFHDAAGTRADRPRHDGLSLRQARRLRLRSRPGDRPRPARLSHC